MKVPFFRLTILNVAFTLGSQSLASTYVYPTISPSAQIPVVGAGFDPIKKEIKVTCVEGTVANESLEKESESFAIIDETPMDVARVPVNSWNSTQFLYEYKFEKSKEVFSS